MFSKLSIQPATVDQLEALHDLEILSIQKLCAPVYGEAIVSRWIAQKKKEDLASFFHDSNACLFTAVYEDEIVGGIGYRQSEISHLFVHPDFKRQGIATRLLHYLEEHAQKHHIAWLQVMSSLNAAAFYASQGYVKTEVFDLKRAENLTIPVVRMHKTL